LKAPALVSLLVFFSVATRNFPNPDPRKKPKKSQPRALLAVATKAAAPSPSSCSASNGAPYDGCTALPSGGTFFWNSTATAGGGKENAAGLLHGALEVPAGLGYSSFGFPARPGAMVGAKVLLLRGCAECATGAALESYSLDGKKGALVVLDPKALEVVSSSSRALPGGAGLASEFVAKLPAVAGAADPSAAQWISASGPMKADGVRPAIHTSFGDGVVDLRSAPNAAALKASASAPAPAPTPEQLAASKLRRRRLHSAHAWLMFLAWGVLVPVAVGVAAACRGISLSLGGGLAAPGGDASVVRGAAGGRTLWFQLHVGLQVLALALTAAGLVSLGVGLLSCFFGGEEGRERGSGRNGKKLTLLPRLPSLFLSEHIRLNQGCGVAIKKPTDHGSKLAHEIIGYVVFAVAGAQAVAGAFRPAGAAPGEKGASAKRARWLAGHRVAGISAAVLAFINLILGLVLSDRGAGFIAGASVVWGALVAGFSAKKVVDARKRARKGAALAEANSSTLAWKTSTSASVVEGGAGGSSMEMGKR